MPKFSEDEKDELLDFIHQHRKEIKDQETFYKNNGAALKDILAVYTTIKKYFIKIVAFGIIAAAIAYAGSSL